MLSAIGARVGSRRWPVDPTRAAVSVQGTSVYEGGAPTGVDAVALRAKMREPHVLLEVTLAEGAASAVAWGCDLSYDYVKINADYTSLTVASSDGTVARDDRLTNYSPGFKRALLVEALSYISKFTSKRAVVKYGGAAMVKDSLKASFANDINLLRSAGLLPIVVHGGGPGDHAHHGGARPRQERVRRRRAHHGSRGREGRRDGADGTHQHRAGLAAQPVHGATPSACPARTPGCSARAS